MHRLEEWQIPSTLDVRSITGLRSEAVEKLTRFRPRTLGAARRIAGVTPSDLSILMIALRAGVPGTGEVLQEPPAELASGGDSGTLSEAAKDQERSEDRE